MKTHPIPLGGLRDPSYDTCANEGLASVKIKDKDEGGQTGEQSIFIMTINFSAALVKY